MGSVASIQIAAISKVSDINLLIPYSEEAKAIMYEGIVKTI